MAATLSGVAYPSSCAGHQVTRATLRHPVPSFSERTCVGPRMSFFGLKSFAVRFASLAERFCPGLLATRKPTLGFNFTIKVIPPARHSKHYFVEQRVPLLSPAAGSERAESHPSQR